jgi:hypothetical protein
MPAARKTTASAAKTTDPDAKQADLADAERAGLYAESAGAYAESAGADAGQAGAAAGRAGAAAEGAGAYAESAGAAAGRAGAAAEGAGAAAERAGVYAERAFADANPPPCGVVAEHQLPDLADDGIRNRENILVCGDAYYIFQLGADVSTAVTMVVEDFFEGKSALDAGPTQDLLCRYVRAGLNRLPGEYVTKVLNTTFNDERVDGLMNSLAAIFDAFERSYAVGQPEIARPLVRAARHALDREILEIQRVFSDKGGGGLRLVVHQAGAELLAGLAIVAAPEVECHAGVRITGDRIATLAALTDQPVEQIRARALKASAVRYVAGMVAGFLDQPLATFTEADLGALSDPLSDYQAASGGASAGGETMTPSDTVAERHRLAVLSRQAVLAPFR